MSSRPDIDEMDVWKQLAAATEEKPVKIYRDAKLIAIEKIKPDPDQPRKTFDEDTLEELAASIEDKGLMQPLVVRPEGDDFTIIAGHRRRIACERIGMQYVPCIIRDISKREAREQALVENIQRDDIPPIEEAESYRQLMDEYDYSVRDMAKRVGKSVGYIHSRLGLLKHPDIAQSVQEERIGIYQARELAKVEDEVSRKDLTDKVASGGLDREGLKRAVKVATREVESETPTEREKRAAVPMEETSPVESPASAEARSATAQVTFEATQETEKEAPPTPGDITEAGESRDVGPAPLNPETLRKHWHVLEQNLIGLDLNSLAEEDREEIRRLLGSMRETIDRLLD
jgi:ParB family chromosome partitioning protein